MAAPATTTIAPTTTIAAEATTTTTQTGAVVGANAATGDSGSSDTAPATLALTGPNDLWFALVGAMSVVVGALMLAASRRRPQEFLYAEIHDSSDA